jgi:hypothetical protein
MPSDDHGRVFNHEVNDHATAVMQAAMLSARGDNTIAEIEEPEPGLVQLVFKTEGKPSEIHNFRFPVRG